MPKFMLLYRGPAPDMASITPEMGKEVMDQWNAWYARNDKAVLEFGAPLIASGHLPDGGGNTDVNGYSIVEAVDVASARGLLGDHPHLADAANSIDIMELAPIPQE